MMGFTLRTMVFATVIIAALMLSGCARTVVDEEPDTPLTKQTLSGRITEVDTLNNKIWLDTRIDETIQFFPENTLDISTAASFIWSINTADNVIFFEVPIIEEQLHESKPGEIDVLLEDGLQSLGVDDYITVEFNERSRQQLINPEVIFVYKIHGGQTP